LHDQIVGGPDQLAALVNHSQSRDGERHPLLDSFNCSSTDDEEEQDRQELGYEGAIRVHGSRVWLLYHTLGTRERSCELGLRNCQGRHFFNSINRLMDLNGGARDVLARLDKPAKRIL